MILNRSLFGSVTKRSTILSSVHSLAISRATNDVASVPTRPFDAIPAPRMIPGLGSMYDYTLGKGQWFRKMHQVQADRCNKLGRIYRENFAGRPIVFLADPDAVEKVFKAEQSAPQKPKMQAWIESRAELGLDAGILSTDMNEWKRFRSPINKILLNAKKMRVAFTDGINDIAVDFVDYLTLRASDTHVVSDVLTEARKLSFEVIGLLVYGKRLNCMEATMRPEYAHFMESVLKILRSYNSLRLSYGLHKKLNTGTYRTNREGWIGNVQFNEQLVAECENRLRKTLATTGDEPYYATCLMEQMLADGKLSRSEVVLNAMDLFSSGIDSIGSALSWTLFQLADNPSIQDRLYKESVALLGPDRIKATPEELQRMILHKNVVKEGLRFSTVFPANFRLLNNDINLLGYNIPAKTLIGVCHYWMNQSAEFFDEPQKFNPDRWSRTSDIDLPHPFSTLPFGHGMRMCPGRRLTELELQVALQQICRRFRLENATKGSVERDVAAMLVPNKPISIRFMNR